jgi:hypothetical protein
MPSNCWLPAAARAIAPPGVRPLALSARAPWLPLLPSLRVPRLRAAVSEWGGKPWSDDRSLSVMRITLGACITQMGQSPARDEHEGPPHQTWGSPDVKKRGFERTERISKVLGPEPTSEAEHLSLRCNRHFRWGNRGAVCTRFHSLMCRRSHRLHAMCIRVFGVTLGGYDVNECK